VNELANRIENLGSIPASITPLKNFKFALPMKNAGSAFKSVN
jgi:hypothetical protein